MKYFRLICCLFLLFTLDHAMAAVSYSLSLSGRILIVPGVDLIRQPIANLSIDADQPYSIELNDINGGFMVNGYHEIPYRVSYDGLIDRQLSRRAMLMESGDAVIGANREIAVTIFGADTAKAVAGDYTTTLTVTITAF